MALFSHLRTRRDRIRVWALAFGAFLCGYTHLSYDVDASLPSKPLYFVHVCRNLRNMHQNKFTVINEHRSLTAKVETPFSSLSL